MRTQRFSPSTTHWKAIFIVCEIINIDTRSLSIFNLRAFNLPEKRLEKRHARMYSVKLDFLLIRQFHKSAITYLYYFTPVSCEDYIYLYAFKYEKLTRSKNICIVGSFYSYFDSISLTRYFGETFDFLVFLLQRVAQSFLA